MESAVWRALAMEGDEHGVAQREWNDSEGIAIQRHPLHAPHEVQGNPMGVQPRINIPAPVYRQKMRIMPILEQLGIDAPIPIFYPTIPPAPHVENQISTHFITYYVAQRRVGRSPADVFRGLILESLNTRLLPLAEDSLPLNDRNVEEFIVRLRRLEEDRVDFVQRMVQDTQRSANAVAGPSNAGNSNQQPTAVPFHSHSPAYPPHAPPLASTQIHQRPAEHPNQQAPKAHHSRFPHVYAPRPPLPPHLTPAQPTTSAPFLPLPTPPSSVLQLPFNSNPLPYSRVPSHSPQNVRPGQLTPDQSPAEPRQAKRPIGTTREASELSVGAREMIDLTLDDDQGEDRLAEGSGAKRPRTTANPDLPPIVPVSTAMAFGASITSRPSAPANLLSPATLLPPAPMRRENWTIPKGLEIPLRSRNTGSASRLPTPPFSVSPEIRPLEFPRLLPAHHPPPPPQASDFMASFQSAPQQPLSRTAKPLAAPPAIVPRRPKPSRTALPPAAPPAIVPRGPKPTAEQKQQVRRLEEVVTQARINDLMVSSPVEADRQQKLFDSALAYRSREELGWKMKSGRNSPTATTKKGESAADAEKRQEVQRLAKLEREAGKLAARARSDAVKERVRLECIEAEELERERFAAEESRAEAMRSQILADERRVADAVAHETERLLAIKRVEEAATVEAHHIEEERRRVEVERLRIEADVAAEAHRIEEEQRCVEKERRRIEEEAAVEARRLRQVRRAKATAKFDAAREARLSEATAREEQRELEWEEHQSMVLGR